MAIDLLDTYPLIDLSADFRLMHFNTISEGNPVLLRACISNNPHPFIPDVYNLAFGPPKANSDTEIDDAALIRHDNLDKVMATLLLFSLSFLTENPGKFVGIDGSCDLRALLYFRKFQANCLTLSETFKIAGNKYYIRFKRFGKPDGNLPGEEQIGILVNGIKDNIDLEDIKTIPEEIDQNTRLRGVEYNYNYFTFSAL